MIIQTTKEINGVVYDYAYSGYMIERDGVRRSEAIDPLDSRRQMNRLTSAQGRKQRKITRPRFRYWVWKRRRYQTMRSDILQQAQAIRASMEYVYGLYYSDPEDNKVYLCARTGEAAGGTVVLQYLPHELVGHYFTEVT